MELTPENLKKSIKCNPSLEDCASFFGVSADTISRRINEWENCSFKEFRSKHMQSTKDALVNKALDLALNCNNIPMLKLCLENYCGWGKKLESSDPNPNIQITISEEDKEL